MAAAAAPAADAKSEPIEDAKEAEAKKKRIERLRKMNKAKLKEAMSQMVQACHSEFDLSNPHLSAAQRTAVRNNLEFPLDRPVLSGYTNGGVRDRPAVKLDKNFNPYCANVAFFYKLAHIMHPNEQLHTKDAAWWKANYPYEYEVSHLYDGVRPDFNPHNLTLESHDVNKSRVFCRLLFEKKEKELRAEGVAEAKAYADAVTFVTPICTRLHNPVCKFLSPDVGRLVDAQLIRRRKRATDNLENKKKQKAGKKKPAAAAAAAADEDDDEDGEPKRKKPKTKEL